jgi:hypothetical protein
MLPIIGLAAALLFFVLWRTGVLDELRNWSLSQRRGPEKPRRDLLADQAEDPEMSKRLEIFEEFIDELPDDEESD